MIDICVPDDLSELDQWCVWRAERGTKVPYQPCGRRASSTDTSTWVTCEQALAFWKARPKCFSGIGFFFATSGGIVGIDLDDCLVAGALQPWASRIVERMADSYMEVSPSGNGIKIWVRGSLPSNVGKVDVENGGIEMYDHSRYFTVTGRRWMDAPLYVEDHSSDVLALHSRLTGGGRGGRWQQQPESDGRIPHGRQHLTLVSIAGTLRRRGVCDEGVEAALQAINAHQCEKPGPPANIAKITQSSRRWRH